MNDNDFLVCRSVQNDKGEFKTGVVGTKKGAQAAAHLASVVSAKLGHNVVNEERFEDGSVIKEGYDVEGRAVDVFTVPKTEVTP